MAKRRMLKHDSPILLSFQSALFMCKSDTYVTFSRDLHVDSATALYEGHLESKERLAIQRYLLIIGKKQNMQVLSHTCTYFST